VVPRDRGLAIGSVLIRFGAGAGSALAIERFAGGGGFGGSGVGAGGFGTCATPADFEAARAPFAARFRWFVICCLVENSSNVLLETSGGNRSDGQKGSVADDECHAVRRCCKHRRV